MQVTLTIDRDVLGQIDALCEREQRPRSQIMEWAAMLYMEQQQRAA